MDRWRLYDELIDAVPHDAVASEALLGWHWTMVRSRGVGMALSPFNRYAAPAIVDRIAGRRVKELAELVKSWDGAEASVGLAAINSVINSREQVERMSGLAFDQQPDVPAFEHYAPRVEGKKVAVVGHFPGLHRLQAISRVSVLERQPQEGDYPDPACEYILPEQDFVFVTSTAIINKTLPRLLELSRGAFVVLLGPSTPLTPILFEHGVASLAGTVVVDEASAWRAASEGASREVFSRGARMVHIESAAEGRLA